MRRDEWQQPIRLLTDPCQFSQLRRKLTDSKEESKPQIIFMILLKSSKKPILKLN